MYLKKKEVAALLRVTVRTVTTYMQQGLIPHPKKVGRILLWDEVELQRSLGHSVTRAANSQVVRRGRPRKIPLPG
jgi:predicted DNA-binding transcriptional regulator AlpA